MLRLIVLCITFATIVFAGPAYSGEGTVTGRFLLDNGKPLADGHVFFFDASSGLDRPVLNKFWRVPDFVHNTDETGSLAVVLPEGDYYIAAIKRMSETRVGPPVEGDYFLPVHDSKGVYRTITVQDGVVSDAGTFRGIRRYSPRRDAYKGKVTALEGKLSREDGTPVGGMYVFAYTEPAMQGRPQFVSVTSNRDGSYRLLLDKGRVVYLRTREAYAGGSPRPGAPFGEYGDGEGRKPVAARTDQIIRGVDIVVRPFAQKVN